MRQQFPLGSDVIRIVNHIRHKVLIQISEFIKKYSTRKVLYCTRRNFTPTRIPILKISSKSDTYALDTPGRKLDPAARESVLSGICSLPRADLLEILNTLFLSLGDDIARIPALNNFVIAKVEEKFNKTQLMSLPEKELKRRNFRVSRQPKVIHCKVQ
ncbi:hypothetical protein JTB14_007384 [Gonioctena quinquepunctata]|nr:hypothetical protein JTB14_007384 [Gonioctena quinquepunctata]